MNYHNSGIADRSLFLLPIPIRFYLLPLLQRAVKKNRDSIIWHFQLSLSVGAYPRHIGQKRLSLVRSNRLCTRRLTLLFLPSAKKRESICRGCRSLPRCRAMPLPLNPHLCKICTVLPPFPCFLRCHKRST